MCIPSTQYFFFLFLKCNIFSSLVFSFSVTCTNLAIVSSCGKFYFLAYILTYTGEFARSCCLGQGVSCLEKPPGQSIESQRNPLRYVLQQQVVILPIDLFPGDSRGEGAVCSVSCGEAVAGKQYSTSSFAVTTERDAPVSVLITLFSLR